MYGITGMPLAGKTVVAEMMEDKGYRLLDMGDVVRKEMDKRDIPTSKTGEFVTSQREEKGMDAIAQLSIPHLEEVLQETDQVVITGMRGWSEKKRFEREIDRDMDIIAIWASRETRKKRRKERRREEDRKGQSFEERDMREIENGMAKLISLSDHLILNDDISLDELRSKVYKFLEGDMHGI